MELSGTTYNQTYFICTISFDLNNPDNYLDDANECFFL